MVFHESITRSIVKSVIYRCLIVAADLIVVFALTRKIGVTIALTILTNIASTVLYYLHERVWNKVHWGRYNLKQVKSKRKI
jgi:adenylylsulfate kinase